MIERFKNLKIKHRLHKLTQIKKSAHLVGLRINLSNVESLNVKSRNRGDEPQLINYNIFNLQPTTYNS